MYYYIYDSDLNHKKYGNLLARIENRLTDLDINGKINHLSFLKNITQILTEEIRRGVKTVVVVGNDKTLAQVINLAVGLDIVIGFIPIESENVARLLNIPEGVGACDILSSRIVRNADLGCINGYYFLTGVETGGQPLSIECDGNYFINLPDKDNIINISNLNYCHRTSCFFNDGHLDLFIENQEKKMFGQSKSTLSHLLNKNIKISSHKSMPILLLDEKRILKTPAEISVAKGKIKLIVGKVK